MEKYATNHVEDATDALRRISIDVIKASDEDALRKLLAETQRVYRLLGGTADDLRALEDAESADELEEA
jgi:hypothetical protein